MGLNKKPYKGCRDFFPADMRVREFLFSQMRKTAELFAFEPYDGPLLEEVELYKAKSGEELINDQIYSFTDRGKREVAIRPEMTPTVARMVANVHKQESKPIRWYSIPNLMRYEKPQRGRVREHWQFNVDIFGAPDNLGEIEIFSLITTFLRSFGATKEMFSILVNDRYLVDGVFQDLLDLDQDSAYKLYKVIDKAKKVTPEKLDIMISEIITDQSKKEIFSNYLSLKSFNDALNFITQYNLSERCKVFKEFVEKINQLEIKDYIKYDPTIVRGLDYYTGIVFEIFDNHPDNNRAIAGGGAYANLLQIFNESPLQGVGFGLGDVTLRDFLETHKLLPDLTKPKHDLFLVFTDPKNELATLNLGGKLRDLGVKVETNLGTMKFNKIFKTAENKGHRLVGILEEKDGELNLQIKDLPKNEKSFYKLNQIQEIESKIKKG